MEQLATQLLSMKNKGLVHDKHDAADELLHVAHKLLHKAQDFVMEFGYVPSGQIVAQELSSVRYCKGGQNVHSNEEGPEH